MLSFLKYLGKSAEYYIYNDPGMALMKMKLLVERLLEIVFEKNQLENPYNNTSFTRIRLFHEDVGSMCLNRIVGNDLAIVFEVINENLYTA